MSVKENLESILKKIRQAEIKYGRKENSVKLCAVSKFHPAESVIEAIEAGQTVFGENRVQEASAKFNELDSKGYASELHIIGSLQRNKVKEAVKIASCIQSVDRIELMDEIEKQCAKIEKKVEVLFELHTGEESKAGFADYDSLKSAVSLCVMNKYPHIIPKGIMTMAPNTDDQELIEQSFSKARIAFEQIKTEFPEIPFSELSMGMSGDFETAIEEGSTMVRIGTAIFGERDYSR